MTEVTSRARRLAIEKGWDVQYVDAQRKVSARAHEVWLDVDQRFSLSLRTREIREDVSRNWPTWRRNIAEFYDTPIGKGVAFLLFYLLLSSGLLWRILSWGYLFLLFAPLFAGPLLQKFAEQQIKAQEEAEREARRAANPFASAWDDVQRAAQSQSQKGSNPGRGGTRTTKKDTGRIIDVDYDTLD